MKNKFLKYSLYSLAAAGTLAGLAACDRDDVDGLQPATLPTTSAVYIDGFSAGMGYAAYGGSKVTAFETDNEVKYEGTSSMRFDIPNAGDPESAWAGGFFYSDPGRDFSGYNCVTFYVKASAGASVDQLGYGVGPDGTTYQAYAADVNVGTAWQKYIIPIADASKLTDAKGLFYFIDTPDDGNGYSFWLDNVQYEDLATIGHKEAKIFGGKDSIPSSSLTGTTYQVSGLGATFNTGAVKQNLILTSSYFTFASSDEAVATVSETGLVTLVGEGTAKITAKLGEDDATGSLTVKSSGGIEPAPVPTQEADKVVSMFSDAYTNVEGINWFTYWQYTTGDANLLTLGDANYMQFDNVNFWGVESTTNLIDATDMTHFHIDVLFPDGSNDKGLVVNIIDFGTDGAYGGATDYSGSTTFPASTFTAGEWASLDIDLTTLTGLSGHRSNIAQLVFVCDPDGQALPTFLMDNAYFYQGEGGGNTGEPGADPTAAATAPTKDAASVKSIFSDAYTPAAGMTFQQWGSTTEFSDVTVGGDTFKKMATMTYFGMELDAITDFSGMTHLHVDVYTTDDVTPNIALVNSAAATGGDPAEASKSLGTLAKGQWVSFDIPLSDFSGVDISKIDQMKMDNGNSATIYMDNLYFHSDGGNTGGNTGGGDPTAAATAPTQDAGSVQSIFSDAYTAVVGVTFQQWGAPSTFSDITVGGDTFKKVADMTYFGIELASITDFSSATYVHLDVYTNDDVTPNFFLVNSAAATGGDAVEGSKALALTAGQWTSFDIPVSEFGAVDFSKIDQMKMDGGNNKTIYIDNLYFYGDGGNTGGNTGDAPTAAAAAPIHEAAKVKSLFSDAYTAFVDVDFDFEGAQDQNDATLMTISGNEVWKYENLVFFMPSWQNQGAKDFSDMEKLHLDVWTPDANAIRVMLQSNSTGAKDVTFSDLTPNTWNSLEITLSDLAGLDLSDLIFMQIFDQSTTGTGHTIYMDNIYFYRTTAQQTYSAPTTAAPVPTKAAADVISIFSDSYTTVAGINYNPNWGQSTQVDATTNVGGNAYLSYTNLNYQGTEFSVIDVSGMTFLHVDVWTTNDNAIVKITPIAQDSAVGEHLVELTGATPGKWTSIDIPLSTYTNANMTLNKVFQMKVDAASGTNPTDVYFDNIYFHK